MFPILNGFEKLQDSENYAKQNNAKVCKVSELKMKYNLFSDNKNDWNLINNFKK